MENKIEPFESIGLCFSGGGYRATFFSLGVVSYLNKILFKKKPLLNHVEAVSSVSGGTLLAVAYAKAAYDPDFDFDQFYKEFYTTFTPGDDELLQNAIEKLEKPEVWKANSHKKRSLINAFALTYADMDVFEGAFEMFKGESSSNLKHVCFNATEFSYGLAFRFQNTGRFGNNPLFCSEINKLSGKIPLGDIVASSSCFPMGFEPLVFPDDYVKDHADNEYRAIKRLEKFSNGVGVMDGGIVDNQGIGSMINIDKSRKAKSLDLIIVNDVGSYMMEPWKPEPADKGASKTIKQLVSGILKLFGLKWFYWTPLLIGVVLILLGAFLTLPASSTNALYIIGGILSGIGLSTTLIGTIAFFTKVEVIGKFKALFRKHVPEELVDEVTSFKNLDINLVKQMILERATSSVKMISEIFLKQIRRLNYDLLYLKEEWKNKVITSTVYQLNGKQTIYKKKGDSNKEIPQPDARLRDVALAASETPTTLWWDNKDIAKDRMDCLIACGQFTTCYNLMDYILKLKDAGISSNDLDETYLLLSKDWKAFNDNPMFWVEDKKK